MTYMVLQAGLEPARSFEQKILSLLCLPIPPPEQVINDFKERGVCSPYVFIILCLPAVYTSCGNLPRRKLIKCIVARAQLYT